MARRDRSAAASPLEPYPDFAEQLKLETDTFLKMRCVDLPPFLAHWDVGIGQCIKSAQNQSRIEHHFTFSASDPRGPKGHKNEIILGVSIDPGQMTYSFAIGLERHLLRRVHFDIDHATDCEPKPICHAQITGRLPPWYESRYDVQAFKTQQLDSLDKPRIPCHPPTFILIAHWALLEYQYQEDAIRRFLTNPTWIQIVKHAEDQVLHRFFDHARNAIKSERHAKSSFLSRCYLPQVKGRD